tara:strand:- start:69 stop:221 length:153 start_codon:yes stop_codon:yes gene_type:complete
MENNKKDSNYLTILNLFLPTLQTGHFQVLGRSSKLVPGGIPCDASPNAGS